MSGFQPFRRVPDDGFAKEFQIVGAQLLQPIKIVLRTDIPDVRVENLAALETKELVLYCPRAQVESRDIVVQLLADGPQGIPRLS